MKLFDLLIFLLSWCVSVIANAGECQRIKFSDGRMVVMRSEFVKSINATMEAPEIKIFSVSVVPPIGDQFVDVSSIIVEPQSEQSPNRGSICALNSGAPNCSSYTTSSGVSIFIYFGNSRVASRDLLAQKVRDYVDKKVLTCP